MESLIKKPIIIAITSGLGNQMFQFALYVHLKKLGKKVFLFPLKKYLNQHNGLELNKLFDLDISSDSIWNQKIVMMYLRFKQIIKGLSNKLNCSSINKLAQILPFDVIVFPCWGDYTFIQSMIYNKELNFKFPKICDALNISCIDKMSKSTSVSIHIRRGDFQNDPEWRVSLGDICDLDYYYSAIELIKSKYKDCTFFIFSDDPYWVKTHLPIENATYVTWNNKENSYIDMFLMSQCKHNIIANSTFSLWGALLNTNPQKVVIAPKKWLNKFEDETYKVYLPKEWNLIDNVKPNISIKLCFTPEEEELNLILSQSYSDFEIILNRNIDKNDTRIVVNHSPRGNFIFNVRKDEIQKFQDKQYLRLKLLDYLYKQKH